MKRQPESTTEDLEDVGADDEDMNALGAVFEEPVTTIGVDGEMLDRCENDDESYIADVNGGFLDLEMVREARVEELVEYLKMQENCRVPVAECDSHRVIKTKWVDTKGDDRSPEIPCRLVAKEMKKRNNTEEESANFFASTPRPRSRSDTDFGSHDQESISNQTTIEDEFH